MLRWHRRLLAALAAGVAVMASLAALSPPAPVTVAVVVARTTLAPGKGLTPADLEVRHFPPELVPQNAAHDPATATGRVLVTGLGPGMPITPDVLMDATQNRPGRMFVPFRIADPGVVGLVKVGDLVTVMGADSGGNPVVIARRVRIAAIPRSGDEGPLSGEGASSLVVVDVDEQTAMKLSAWSSNPGLTLALG